MGRRNIAMIEISEVLYRWVKKMPKKRIARSLGMSINTVRKIIRNAESLGFTEDENDLERMNEIGLIIQQSFFKDSNKTAQMAISEHHDRIATLQAEKHMTRTQIKRLLEEEGVNINYSSLSRYMSKHFPKSPKSTVVLHTEPGKEAQVDFCYAGLLYDPIKKRKRKAYAFVMTLSFSRYRYVRFVFHQDVKTWIDCHIRAFSFFGGVPKTIILDNLKSGVIKPDIYDPTINKNYAECERYYGFVADPAKVRTPKHKGKVERNMPMVRQQILAGRSHSDIQSANRYAEYWCRHEISQRVTRTTGEKPFERFVEREKGTLLALPSKPYECPLWQTALVHKDHHVVFLGSFYSVPTAYIGKTVWLRAGRQDIQIFCDDRRIKIHAISNKKGAWITDMKDYPENARKFLEIDSEKSRLKAKSIGSDVERYIEPLLKPFSRQQQRKVLAIFNLSETYGEKRLNLACKRALSFGNNQVGCLKNILKKGLESSDIPEERSASINGAYIRDPGDFITNL